MAEQHCKICHARGLNLGPDGRCCGCRMAFVATRYGLHYGAFMGLLYERGVPAETLFPEDLPQAERKTTGGRGFENKLLPDL